MYTMTYNLRSVAVTLVLVSDQALNFYRELLQYMGLDGSGELATRWGRVGLTVSLGLEDANPQL